MSKPLRVLLVEDSEDDAFLLERELRKAGYDPRIERVEEEQRFRETLRGAEWDVVIADYRLPRFSGLEALATLQQVGVDVPFILVSGTIGEQLAVQGMKAGAHDYILKDNLQRLVPAVERELREAEDRRQRRRAESALRERERDFRDLVQAVPGTVYRFRMDAEGRPSFPFVSERIVEMLGMTAMEVMVDYTVWERCVEPEAKEEALASIEASRSQMTPWVHEFPVVTRSGERKWLRGQSIPSAEEDGGTLWHGVLVDVTERKKAEEQRLVLEMQLRQAQKMEAIGTLAGGIAHDFNNILAAVIPYAHLAKADAGDNTAVQESLDEVLKAADRAKNLVKQILMFSRQQKQERRPTQVELVVKEALKLMRSALPATIEIKSELEAGLPSVVADATQLHQVLMNLCTNAAHAMRAQGGRLTLRLQRLIVDASLASMVPDLRTGLFLKLEVCDTGHGMSPEVLKRVFDPFFTTKGPGEGTGLGLSVVHGILKEHEGAIAVSSGVGRGTVFTLYLPAQASAGGTEAVAVEKAVPGRGEHILFVDDEKVLCNVVKRLLERLGYQVTVQNNPLEAWAMFQADPTTFDVVFTDLTMPGMTGVDLALQMLKMRPELPVILATGYGGAWTPDAARRLGIREVVLKPLDLNAFASIVHGVLHPAGRGSGGTSK